MKRLFSLSLIIILVVAALPLITTPKAAHASPSNATVQWIGEYFNNAYLLNPPALTRTDFGIDGLAFNWGLNPPAPTVQSDNFSVRWGANPTFENGTYRFYMTADDSFTVTLDFNNRILDTMESPKPAQTFTVDVNMTAGQHHIQVDFREWLGDAYINFSWVKLSSTGLPPAPVPTPGGSGIPQLPTGYPAAYVNTDSLRLRSGPGLNYFIIDRKPLYTVVQLLGRNGDGSWAKVQLADKSEGWMSTYYLVANVAFNSLPIVDSIVVPPTVGQLLITINTGALNVRSGPSTLFPAFSIAYAGNSFVAVGRNGSGTWIQIRLANNALGWVSGFYVNVNGNVMTLPVTG
jgi:uncharacterized protein YraI